MDQELQNLIRQLREEKCPPAVLDRVAQRLSRQKPSSRPYGVSLVWAVSIVFLLVTAALWQWHARREAQAQLAAAQEMAHRAAVLQETQEALGYLGQALMHAADRTENALLRDALPPFRNSLETVKNKVTNPIEP